MHISQKTIVITGSTSGVGLELVKQLQAHNQLIVLAKDPNKVEKLKIAYPHVHCELVDLADLEAIKSVLGRIRAQTPVIDWLVNNAAVQYTPAINHPSFNPSTIEREITINFTAVCYLCHGLLPLLQQSDNALILNINSGLGLVPKMSSAVYCGTKGALHLFSQSLGYQLEADQVQVLQAFLPLVDTAMTAGRGATKISPEQAAMTIIKGAAMGIRCNHIGQIRWLVLLQRWLPWVAKNIMRRQ